ncbi:hypothetical protein N0B44_05025 [Roseibacterium beibuensis]|nr:hypothetical protein [Roseibacterium beibuensis]MCS6622266.1 hypothetical protein [Roseibacterium beibuensis]
MTSIEIYRPGIAEVKGGKEWSALEADLLAECRLGRMAVLPSKEELPPDCSDPDRRVRAGLIRYLMLGGCEDGPRPHPTGVWIRGGWIDGVLDLESCKTPLDLGLENCRLPERANLHAARIGALYLPGCAAPQGLDLQRLTTRGDVHLREGFKAGAGMDLAAARIGGQFSCAGGAFEASEGEALNCNGAQIGASVFLCDKFRAMAEVNFGRAEIGGQLNCTGGAFEAAEGRALNCDAARIGADVILRADPEHPDKPFLAVGRVNFTRADVVGVLLVNGAEIKAGITFHSARIGHGLFWKKVTGARELIDLTEARVRSLHDDRASWEGVGRLILDGFRYDRIDGSMSVAERIAWLGRAAHRPRVCAPGAPDHLKGPDFDPQPHVQLATVLRAQGNRDGAARVLVDRETRQRRASRLRAHARLDGTWRTAWQSLQANLKAPVDFLFWLLAGYGHRPARALGVSLVLVLLASGLAHFTYAAGQFAPNSDVVLTSADWLGAVAAHAAGDARMPVQIWQETSPTAQDYETFQPLLYGLDLFIPLDALGQEEAWRPSTERGVLGEVAFYSRWFFQGAGWIITALAAAVLTGLVGRRD